MAFKTFARIQDQMVGELLTTDLDISDRYNSAIIWVDVSMIEGIAPGWQQTASGFAPPPRRNPPTMPSLVQLQAQLAVIGAQLAALSTTT